MKKNIEQRRISVTSKRGWCPARKGMLSLWEPHKGAILQSVTGEELGVLLQRFLDKAFKGEL